MLLGTIVNMIAVIIGGIIGMLVNDRIPDRIKNTVFQGIGLFVLVLGVKLAMGAGNPLILVFSILIGSIIGEVIHLENKFERMSNFLKSKLKFIKSERFTEGMMAAFLLFCMGSMVILGSIEEGIQGKHNILFTKSLMDGFAAIALASTYGIGVLFSVIPMFIYQGGLTFGASLLQDQLDTYMVTQISAVGGLLLMALGLNLLELKKIRVGNMLPALLVVVILASFVR